MPFDAILSLRDDEAVTSALRQASLHQIGAEELMEQRISFVFGSLDTKSQSMTKEQVREVIIRQQDGAIAK